MQISWYLSKMLSFPSGVRLQTYKMAEYIETLAWALILLVSDAGQVTQLLGDIFSQSENSILYPLTCKDPMNSTIHASVP